MPHAKAPNATGAAALTAPTGGVRALKLFRTQQSKDHALDKSHGLRDLEPEAMEFAL